MFRNEEAGPHGYCISGDYDPPRGDCDVFRHWEDSPRSGIVQVIHQVVGVSLKYFPLLAACEFAGALGVVLGIWWPLLGVAGSIGLVIYFVGASLSHLRVGDVKGIGPAAFILVVAAAALVLRILTYKLHSAG
jgi:DoxX-like family